MPLAEQDCRSGAESGKTPVFTRDSETLKRNDFNDISQRKIVEVNSHNPDDDAVIAIFRPWQRR
jgi:hypothetical protein